MLPPCIPHGLACTTAGGGGAAGWPAMPRPAYASYNPVHVSLRCCVQGGVVASVVGAAKSLKNRFTSVYASSGPVRLHGTGGPQFAGGIVCVCPPYAQMISSAKSYLWLAGSTFLVVALPIVLEVVCSFHPQIPSPGSCLCVCAAAASGDGSGNEGG